MKKTLLSLATLLTAGVLSMAADCSGTNVESCTADADCTVDGQICDLTDPEAGVCADAQCTENNDCAIAGSTSEWILAETCATDADCEDTCVVDTLDNSYCGIAEDAAIDFLCADNAATAITVSKAEGGTVTICVDSDSTCDGGICG